MMNAISPDALAARIDSHRERALDTIRRDVGRFESHVIVEPSPTYEGFWARDTMIIALGLIDSGWTGLAADLLRTWAHYGVAEHDAPDMYVLLNKHRLDWMETEVSRPDAAWLYENRGGLPTSIYVGRDGYLDGTREIYSCHPDPDSTAWWIVACGRYVAVTGDERFRQQMEPALQAAMDALIRRDSDGDLLIEQCPNEDWADHWRRHGKVMYTQAVWYGAVQAGETLGLVTPASSEVRAAIRDAFWRKNGRVLDWRCPRAHSERVTQDSSLLILAGVLDAEEGLQLLRRLDALASPFGHRVVTPGFRSSRMGPYHFRLGEYQNGAIWTWLTGWEAQARAQVGDIETALQLIESCFCPTCDRIYEWINPRTGDRYNPDFATGAGSLLSAMAAAGH